MTEPAGGSSLAASRRVHWILSILIWLAAAGMIALATVGAAGAQTPILEVPRAYDVCSIKPSSGLSNSSFGPLAGGGFAAIQTTVAGLVTTAFDVKDFQVL
jgi:hypothetical protein